MPYELVACGICGKAFVRNVAGRTICPDCREELDRLYRTLRAFLRDHPDYSLSVSDLAELFGVEEKKIQALVSEGQLLPGERGIRSEGVCRICRSPLSSGTLCPDCDLRLRQEAARRRREVDSEGF